MGVRLPNKTDIAQLTAWLTEFILPLNPQAVHGSELVTDWCQAQQIERPAADHLERIIRSAVHQFETEQQNIIFTRLSLDSKVAINHLLLMVLIHNLGTLAEKKVDKKQFAAFKKVRGKARLLFRMAEATVDQPDGVIKEVVYPVVS